MITQSDVGGGNRKHVCCAFLVHVNGGASKPTLFNYPKHVTDILHHDPGDGGDGIDVVFAVVGEMDAGHEVKVFEDGVQALTGAGVEIAQWCIGVDEQDGMVGGGVGHWGVVAQL